MDDAERNSRLRALPSIDEVLAWPSIAQLASGHARRLVVQACREAVAQARARALRGEPSGVSERDVVAALDRLGAATLRRVINATGVVLHTNLGRAPLSTRAVERMAEVATGYANLEMDLASGERSDRTARLADLLRELCGCEDALVVNNGAAAVLLTLGGLAAGREVVVSRGELVEIGGGFRIPDVMRHSGALLVEVGTTNRTTLDDYRAAIGPKTGLLVKVHRSNFALVGFTSEVTTRELAGLAKERGLPLYEDLGSGLLRAVAGEGLVAEPTVASTIGAGADLVSFSGDKLLGGPQAGLLVGRAPLIAALRKHSLCRALRIDRLTVAALEATLEAYRNGSEDEEVPVRRVLGQTLKVLEARAEQLAAALASKGVAHRVVRTVAQVGGGAMPLSQPPSMAVALQVRGAAALHDRLRAGSPAVVARIADDEVWLDVRCLSDAEVQAVAEAVATAVGVSPC